MNYSRSIRLFFVMLLIVASKLYSNAQIKQIAITHELDTVTQICFEFDDKPEVASYELTIHLNYQINDGLYYGHGFKFEEFTRKGTTLNDFCLDTTFRYWNYRLFYSLKLMNSKGELLSDKFYCENPSNYGVLSFDYSEGNLTSDQIEEYKDLSGRIKSSKPDPYWQIRYSKKNYADGPNNDDSHIIPAWKGNILINKTLLNDYKVRTYIYDLDFGIDRQMAHEKLSMFAYDTTIQTTFSSGILEKEAPYQLHYFSCSNVDVVDKYVHRDVSQFKFLKQQDSLIQGTMFRKIDFEVDNSLSEEENHVRTNLPVDAYYFYDGKIQPELHIKPGSFHFSIIYPSRSYFTNALLKVELGNTHIPYNSAILIPERPISKSDFQNIAFKIKPKQIGRYAMVIGGDHKVALEKDADAFIENLTGYDFSPLHQCKFNNDGHNWNINLHREEMITILIFNQYRRKLLTHWTGSVKEGTHQKNKLQIAIPGGDEAKLKFKYAAYLEKKKYHEKKYHGKTTMRFAYEVSPD